MDPPPLNLPDLDDAFADGDAAASFRFSSDVLREELASYRRPSDDQESEDTRSFGLQEVYESLPSIHVGHTAQNLQRNSSSTSHTPESSKDLSASSAESENTEDAYSGSTSITGSADAIRVSIDSAVSEGAIQSHKPSDAPGIFTQKSEPLPDSSLPSFSSLGPPDASTTLHLPHADSKPLDRPPMHRQSRSAGPSVFEKVMSKTRPSFLPPKPKQEDRKHLADWQNMMKMSQLAG